MKQLVYAMRDRDTQLVKIGISVDPNVRAVDVAKQFCANVELLGTLEVEDARKVEQFLHSALSAHRVIGEWFQPDVRTLDYVLAFFVKERPKDERIIAERLNIKELIENSSAMETDAVIREAIRAEMKRRRMTQQELADLMGVQQSSIARLLTGGRSKQPPMLLKVLETLDLELTVTPKPK